MDFPYSDNIRNALVHLLCVFFNNEMYMFHVLNFDKQH